MSKLNGLLAVDIQGEPLGLGLRTVTQPAGKDERDAIVRAFFREAKRFPRLPDCQFRFAGKPR